jgi:hypothetical protein
MIIDRDQGRCANEELLEVAKLMHNAARLEDIRGEWQRIMSAFDRCPQSMALVDTKPPERTQRFRAAQRDRTQVMMMLGFKIMLLAHQAAREPGDEPWRQRLRNGMDGVIQRIVTNLNEIVSWNHPS